MTRVVCQQLAPAVGQFTANVSMATEAIGEARRSGAQVIVLPELVTSGYVFESPEEARSVAIPRGHVVFDDWSAAAGDDAVVVAGYAELGDDDLIYNSAAVLAPGLEPTYYRKLHLWDTEKKFFTPGWERPPVVDTVHGRVGVIICYDLEFPELTRLVGLSGADLLAVPTNWPLVERPATEHAPEVMIGMAAARVNKLAIACCDRAGVERGQEWTEGSAIIGSDGWVVADSTSGSTVVADLDLTAGRDKQISERNDLFGDRRTDVY